MNSLLNSLRLAATCPSKLPSRSRLKSKRELEAEECARAVLPGAVPVPPQASGSFSVARNSSRGSHPSVPFGSHVLASVLSQISMAYTG